MSGLLSKGRRHYNEAHKISPNDSISQLGYYMASDHSSSSTALTKPSCFSSHSTSLVGDLKRQHNQSSEFRSNACRSNRNDRMVTSKISLISDDFECFDYNYKYNQQKSSASKDHTNQKGGKQSNRRSQSRSPRSSSDGQFRNCKNSRFSIQTDKAHRNNTNRQSKSDRNSQLDARVCRKIDQEYFEKVSTCTDQTGEFCFMKSVLADGANVGLANSNPRLARQIYSSDLSKSQILIEHKGKLDPKRAVHGQPAMRCKQELDGGNQSSDDQIAAKNKAKMTGLPLEAVDNLNKSRLKRRNGARHGNRRMMGWNDDETYFLNPYALSELFSQSEIPGFREIFASDSYLRKFCWIIAFLLMTVLSLNDMTELITEYYDYPITVGLRLRDEPRLPFPSVTVCNLNVVRFSALCSSNVNARYNLTNQIPSEMRDRLCGIQIASNKNKTMMDSDISDINNIGITTTIPTTTTTTASTTSSTTTMSPLSSVPPAFLPNITENFNHSAGNVSLAVPGGIDLSGSSPLLETSAKLQTPTNPSIKSKRHRTIVRENGAIQSAEFRPNQQISALSLSSSSSRLSSPILRGPFSSRNIKVNVANSNAKRQLDELSQMLLVNSTVNQENRVQSSEKQRLASGGKTFSALSRLPPQNERQGQRNFVQTTSSPSLNSPQTTMQSNDSDDNNSFNSNISSNNTPTYNTIVVPSIPEEFGYNERIDRELQENLTNWLAVMYQRDPELTLSLGHQFEDMILRCTMKYNNCTHERSFVNTFTPTEGNCFTYKSKMRRANNIAKPSGSGPGMFDEVNLAGANQGLELVLNLEKNEYISGSSQVGALVMIHHPGDDSGYAASEATFIAPEFTTYIGLKMVNISRLPAPYPEKCVHTWPSKFADRVTRNREYSQQGCLKTCLQRTIQNHCQCQSATLPILELDLDINAQFGSSSNTNIITTPSTQSISTNSTTATANSIPEPVVQSRIIICDTRKHATRQCVTDVTLRAAERVHNCDCPPKCQVVRYDKTVSMARWPTREDKVTFDRNKVDFNFQNLAKVIVYFQTMTCDEITQQPVYNAAKLFSSLGGIMGMYVGFSFLSIFEIFEVISRKTWHHYRMKWTNTQA